MKRECKALHETFIKDALELIDIIKQLSPEEIINNRRKPGTKYTSTSIAKLTDNLVCVFPVMVSSSMSIDTATMIAKAIERKAAVMLQLLFASAQVQDYDTLDAIISQFHTNIKLRDKMSVDDAIGFMDHLGVLNNSATNPSYQQLQAIKEDMKNINFYFEESVNPLPVGSMSITYDPYNRKTIIEDSRNRSDYPTRARTVNDVSKSFSANDIKKANELMPTTLAINFYYKPKTGEPILIEGAVLGIKARLIPVASNDVITHIISKVEDKNWLLQFLRGTTREISFAKDFLFAIKKAKIDALANSRQGSANPMWKVLERRALGSRLKRLLGSNNSYMAITTLCVSQEDVDYVRKEYNINFEDPSNIDPLFSNFNLLCVCIVDEALEVAKFMFDTGDGNWENYSFTSLEREDKDNTYKKVVNLMTKVAR